MSTRRKQLGAALAAAAVLGFGSYALGTQAGDGSAAARGGQDRPARAGGPFALDGLADRLGVEESELREALADIRRERRGEDPRDEFAAALAEALGLPQERVSEALEQEHERRHEEMREALAEALAAELGLEASEVRAALEEAGPPRRAGRPGPPSRRAHNAFLRRLARELGVSRRRLRNALEAARPERAVVPGPDRHGPELERLADALGVSEDELESAMEEVRERMEARWEERHEEFVNALAERLGIPAERVEDALPPRPPHVRPAPRPGGPPGPPPGP